MADSDGNLSTLQDFPQAVCTDGWDSGAGEGAVTLLQALPVLQPKSDTFGGWVLQITDSDWG